MLWYLLAIPFPVRFDVQKNPVPAIVMTIVFCVVLRLLIVTTARRDRSRAARRDSTGWRERQRHN